MLITPLICGTILAIDPAVLQEQNRRVAVVESAAPSVVAIFSQDGKGGGSGVLVSPDGYTVTNYHVVEDQGPFMKCGLNDGHIYDAVLVGLDPTGDVALIQMLGRTDFPAARIGDSDKVQVGDWAYAMGNPFLLATDFAPTVTYGIVSGVHRYQYPAGTFLEYTDCIQVDASINPGNSGGPLFNDQGELIGINGRGSFEKRGRVNSGAGYAISFNQVLNFLDHLKSGKIVDHATLGATVSSGNDGSVYVSRVLEQSEAFRRGLRVGDELVSFAGRPIRSVNQFKNVLGIYPSGWKVPLVYRRDKEEQEVVVRLRALHRQAEMTPGEGGKKLPIPGEPKPKRPGPGEEPAPGQPRPKPKLPIPGMQGPPAIPTEYAHLYVEKPGYANAHFNDVRRDALLASIQRWGDFRAVSGKWEWSGATADGRPVNLKLSDQAVASIIGESPAVQLITEPFADQPPGTGGLLAALFQFRQLLLRPKESFTELYYLGSEPLDGRGPRVDVLVTTKGTVTSRWYFSREDHRLLGWDTALEEDADECEVRISGEHKFDARTLPEQFDVRCAGASVLAFKLTQATLGR